MNTFTLIIAQIANNQFANNTLKCPLKTLSSDNDFFRREGFVDYK